MPEYDFIANDYVDRAQPIDRRLDKAATFLKHFAGRLPEERVRLPLQRIAQLLEEVVAGIPVDDARRAANEAAARLDHLGDWLLTHVHPERLQERDAVATAIDELKRLGFAEEHQLAALGALVAWQLEKELSDPEQVRRLSAQIALRLREHPGADGSVEWDGTSAAHPAWWRGQDDGVRGATERVRHALDVDLKMRPSGTLGYAPLQQVVEDIRKLRLSADMEVYEKQQAIIQQLKRELAETQEKLKEEVLFHKAVDEALNSGDGTYRP